MKHHHDYHVWEQTLQREFPSTDIETTFDLASPIYEAYEAGLIPPVTIRLRGGKETPRQYLGASGLGGSCARKTWAQWRGLSSFEGRLLRLFRTGDVYEERMRAELVAIGFEAAGDQARFEACGGRVAGHSDGFVRYGDMPWALWEAKTANHKRTTELKKLLREQGGEGLKEWDAKYWGQIHLYMAAFDVHVCLYSVTNKDRDERLDFLVERDDRVAVELGERAREILEADGPPARAYQRPSTPQCTIFCDQEAWCWGDAEMPRACGTCTSWRDGRCDRTGEPALAICDHYEAVPFEAGDIVSDWEML